MAGLEAVEATSSVLAKVKNLTKLMSCSWEQRANFFYALLEAGRDTIDDGEKVTPSHRGMVDLLVRGCTGDWLSLQQAELDDPTRFYGLIKWQEQSWTTIYCMLRRYANLRTALELYRQRIRPREGQGRS